MRALSAEILSPESKCYVVEVFDHHLAYRQLAARGFGVMAPGYFRFRTSFGKIRTSWVNMLPGYLLIRVFGLNAQWGRIVDTPGVKQILHIGCEAVEIEQDFIDRLMAAANDEEANAAWNYQRREQRDAGRRRRRSRKSRRARARNHAMGIAA